MRILLADDEEQLLRTLSKLLRRWGYEVNEVTSKELALEKLATERFGLLITDIEMPRGTEAGMELLRELRTVDTLLALRVIVTTGGREDLRGEAEKLGARFLPKPYPADQLQAMLVELGIFPEKQTE